MHEEATTVIIQRYLDALPGDPVASRLFEEMLDSGKTPEVRQDRCFDRDGIRRCELRPAGGL